MSDLCCLNCTARHPDHSLLLDLSRRDPEANVEPARYVSASCSYCRRASERSDVRLQLQQIHCFESNTIFVAPYIRDTQACLYLVDKRNEQRPATTEDRNASVDGDSMCRRSS